MQELNKHVYATLGDICLAANLFSLLRVDINLKTT